MSVISAAPLFTARNSRSASYQIEQSLRFDGSSTYLVWNDTVTPDSAARNLWTLSMWIKRTSFASLEYPFSAYQNSNNRIRVSYGSDDKLASEEVGGGASKLEAISGGVYRDPSAWYHVVVIYDTDAASQENRLRLYVNGVDDSPVAPSTVSGWAGVIGDNGTYHNFGSLLLSSRSYFWRGYIAEVHLVAGQGQEPTAFGEYDDNGVWRPIEYTGTYGTHGYYLKFDPSATNGIGHDHSGNGNHFTASGFTTSGTGTDVMSDTPTNNFCTLNPISVTSNLPSGYTKRPPFNGNLSVTFGQGQAGVDANFGITPNSGKFYWEVQVDTSGSNQSTTRWGVLLDGSNWDIRNAQDITSVSNGDVLGFAVDANAGTIDYYKNNTLQGTSPYQTFTSGWELAVPWMGVSANGSRPDSQYTFNFGQRDFAYTPPTGFKALNTSNLPAPDIADGSDYFQTVTYTGTGATRDITVADNSSNAWQPDLVWIKNRDIADHHALFDPVRGVLNYISSNRTNAEAALANSLTAFNTDGFELGSANLINYLNQAYVAWNWKAGGTGSSNTAGSITSTVSANPTAGFSIVSFNKTTANTVTSTFGHGLGVAPKMIIVKHRDQADNWRVYTETTGNNARLQLNTTDASITPTNTWGTTSPTSTVFSLQGALTGEYVAYCFAEVEGYSKFGKYTGNGSTDGPFVHCGFKPAWVMWKQIDTDTDRHWVIRDSVRDVDNPTQQTLYPGLVTAEQTLTSQDVNFLSNGFKIRSAWDYQNASSRNYIYAAFAENPFGGSGVSPATAR